MPATKDKPTDDGVKIDPYITSLTSDLGIDLDASLKEATASTPEGRSNPVPSAELTLSEMMQMPPKEEEKKEGDKEDPPKEEDKEDPPKEEEKEDPPKDEEKEDPPKQKLVKDVPIPPTPLPEPPKQDEPKKPAEDPPKDKGDSNEGLDIDQVEEVEFAAYAEKKHPDLYKGRAKKTREFFRKVAEFEAQNPDAEPDGEEFQQFLQKHKPEYRQGDRRRLERLQLKEEVLADYHKTQSKEMQETKRKLELLEKKPKVEKAVKEFTESMTSENLKLPEGVERIPEAVGEAVRKNGLEAASLEFPIEAEVYESHRIAGETYIQLINNSVKFNRDNPLHAFISGFVQTQEQAIASDDSIKMKDGKLFLSGAQYNQVAKSQPEQLGNYWTLSDTNILDMIAVRASQAVTSKHKTMQRAGYSRKPVSGSGKQGEPEKKPSHEPSPKAGSSKSDGASGGEATKTNPNAEFLNKIFPGGADIVAGG